MACVPYPLAAPIANVTLANGNTARGIGLGIGAPVQSVAFMPMWPHNNTYVYDEDGLCVNETSAWCTTYRGGKYDRSASSSSTRESNAAAAGGFSTDDIWTQPPEWIQDDFFLNTNTTIPDFPIGIAREDVYGQYYSQMLLGLGRSSTILSLLYSTEKVASRSWSMFWGLTGATADQQSNGTFVLGGIDAAKVKDQDLNSNYTQAFNFANPSCETGALVAISDLAMRYPNGTRASLFSGSRSTALNACIDPGYTGLMTLPLEYYEQFESICQCQDSGRSFGIDFYGMLFSEAYPSFVGDLIIEIASAIDITIANSQLLSPEVTIDSDGRFTANSTMNTLAINSIQQVNAKDLPRLGRKFLSSAMMMGNLDTETFTLWEATPSSGQALLAVDTSGRITNSFCAASSERISSTPTTTSVPVPAPEVSIGAIAGGAVGGAIGLICVLAAIFFLVRRHRRNNAAAPAEDDYGGAVYYSKAGYLDVSSDRYTRRRYSQKLDDLKPRPHVPAYGVPVELPSTPAFRSELP